MIDRIEIRNFKCHRIFEETLNKLTILTGSNAVGKSSVIQAVLLAMKSYDCIEEKKVRTNNVFGINLGIPINIISESFESDLLKICFRIRNCSSNEVLLKLGDSDVNENYFDIINCDEMLENIHVKNMLHLFYINAERKGPRITYEIDTDKQYYVGSQGEYTGYVINEIDKLQKLNKKFNLPEALKSSKIERFSANCEAWLQTIIPGTRLQYSVDIEKNISTVKFQNEGDYYLPTATGFGISYVLPIIVQALVASMMENAVLIVENPEAHLHPFSQSAIGKFLAMVATSGVQVIIETHSEHVIDGSRLQLAYLKQCEKMKTLFFYKDDSDSSYKTIITQDNGELNEWPKGFFDQKRQDLRELLEMRRCGK